MSKVELVKVRALQQLEKLLPHTEITEEIFLGAKALEILSATSNGGEGDSDHTDIYINLTENRDDINNLITESIDVKGKLVDVEEDVYLVELAVQGNSRQIEEHQLRLNEQASVLDSKLDKTSNAVTASKLLVPRAITLTGDARGTTNFDGSDGVNLELTLTAEVDAVAVGGIEADFITENKTGSSVIKPKGGEWRQLGNAIGALKLILPRDNNALSTDFIFKVSIFNGNGKSIELFISASIRDGRWFDGFSASMIGGNGSLKIRYCSEKNIFPYIAIGEDDTDWIGSSATLTDVIIGGVDRQAETWCAGWSFDSADEDIPRGDVKYTLDAEWGGTGGGGNEEPAFPIVDDLSTGIYGYSSTRLANALNEQIALLDREVDDRVEAALIELVDGADSQHNTLGKLCSAVDSIDDELEVVKRLFDTKLGRDENAASATVLRTPRQIELTGYVSGKAVFDGSTDISIETVVDKLSTLPLEDPITGTTYTIGFDESGSLQLHSASHSHTIMNSDGDLIIAGNVKMRSDERLKENFTAIDKPLERLLSIEGLRYKRRDNGRAEYGVVAQRVRKVFPELTEVDNSGYQSVAYSNMVAIIIEALREEVSHRTQLEKRVHKLEKYLSKYLTKNKD